MKEFRTEFFRVDIMIYLPEAIYDNKIARHLNSIRTDYMNLSGRGDIKGILCSDQDAKVISIDRFFDKRLNVWDLSALGAALHGISKQGISFFNADKMQRATLIYGDTQFIVRSIGNFEIEYNTPRELLIIILADRKVNIGLIILQLNKYAKIIRKDVQLNSKIKDTLKMSEEQMRMHIKQIKNQLFREIESTETIERN